MQTFAAWEATVLEQTYDQVDYISLHAYYDPEDGDVDTFLATRVDMESFIENVVATCDHVAREGATEEDRPLLRRVERLVHSGFHDEPDRPWAEPPRLLEDVYSVTDAVVVGTLLITLLRHADRVKIACLAQLVNVDRADQDRAGRSGLAPDDLLPVRGGVRVARGGVVLRVELDAPRIETERYGSVPALEATAIWHDSDGRSRSSP